MATTRRRKPQPTTLTFDGPPDAVEAYLPVDPARRKDIRVSVDSGTGWVPVTALTAPAGQQTLVRLVLPASTAAGDLDALVEAGDERFEAVVHAARRAELDCTPSALDLVVDGSEATATVHVLNTGNTVVELPDIAAFGLMSEGALENAIGAGLMSEGNGFERMARLTDSLADGHGGLARVSIDSGAGPLEPGAATTMLARFRLGERPVAGRRYRGTWPLANLRIAVVLRIPEVPRARRSLTGPITSQAGPPSAPRPAPRSVSKPASGKAPQP